MPTRRDCSSSARALHFFTLLAFTTLVAVKRNRLYPIAMLLGVVVNIGLNLILIPEYGYMGSGWATVVTEVLVLARARRRRRPDPRAAAVPVDARP